MSGLALSRALAIESSSATAIVSDKWIRAQALEHGMIEPFVEAQRRDGVISCGLSPYGYDARVAPAFKIFANVDSSLVDPKQFDPKSFFDRETDCCINPPASTELAQNRRRHAQRRRFFERSAQETIFQDPSSCRQAVP